MASCSREMARASIIGSQFTASYQRTAEGIIPRSAAKPVCGDNQLILNLTIPSAGIAREAVRRHRDRRRDHRRRLRVAAGEAGQSVTLIDNGQPGATAAGIGHLVCMDDDPAELALSAWSLERWRAITPRMPDNCASARLRHAVAGGKRRDDRRRRKQRRMAGHQVHSERQTPQQIAGREPLLRGGLAGGLWVPGDGIVYAPNVARWLIADAGDHLTCLRDSVQTIDEPQVLLASGQRLQARAIVVACGLEANALLAENWLRPKKANWRLPIATGRGCSTSWLSWVTAPAPGGGTSVAFNLQPRPTGQLLIGSSRQFDNRERELDLPCWRRCSIAPAISCRRWRR